MNTEIKLLHPPLTGPFPPDRAADPTFDLVVRELGRARERVEIFMYVWRSDETGTRIGEAVLEAAERGVKVHIIKDLGALMCEVIEMNRKPIFPRKVALYKRIAYKLIGYSFPDTFVTDSYDQKLGERLLAHPNVTVEWINKTHTKYYIFDERLLITGSINIEDRHQNYFDYMLALTGPAIVQRLRSRMSGKEPYDPRRSLDFLCNVHYGDRESIFEIKPAVLSLIREARESIYVEVAYIGDPQFANALIAAAERGGRVTVLFSKEANIGNDVNYWAVHELYLRSLGRIEVYLTETMIHAKLLLFDEKVVLTGSCNMNIFSLQKAAELNLVIRKQPALLESLRRLIDKRLAASSRVESREELTRFNPLLAHLQQFHQKLNPN